MSKSKGSFWQSFMALNDPINLGAPSIMETVYDWIAYTLDYTEGAKKKCSNETGVPLEILNTYWGMFVACSDIPSSELTQENILKSWIRHFPNGTRNACNAELHLGSKFIATHWEECGGVVERTKISEAGDIVRQWIQEHPNGTFYECYKETGLRAPYVKKYWPDYMNNATVYDLNDMIRTEKVKEWIKANPNGVITECASQLRIERSLIERVWTAAGGEELNNGSLDDRKKKIISDWIDSGKQGGVMQCVKDTGLSKHSVGRLWKECGGSSLNVQEQRAQEIENTIKEWLEKNPLGSPYDCSKDTELGKNTVRKYWFKCDGKSVEARLVIKISDYLKLYPDGNKAECATYINEFPKTVARYFDKCKDPDYCKEAINSSGSEKLRETISKWIEEHPDGTVKECQKATGYSAVTIHTYWHQLGGRKLTRRYTPKEKKQNHTAQMNPDSFDKIAKWVKENPGKGKKQCREETGVSRRAVTKYWEEANGIGMSTAKRNSNRDKVQKWFEENPDGTNEACSKATGVSTAVIVKFVKELGLNDKEHSEKITKLKAWFEKEENRFGSKLDCGRDTGLGPGFISKHWTEFGGFVGSKKERMYYQVRPILEKWWAEHPDGAVNQCHRDTGIGTIRIKMYLEEINETKE